MRDIQHIFLVDDDEDDVFIFKTAFKTCFPDCQITVFPSGSALLNTLAETTSNPSCIFLDLKMPGLHGLETLTSLKLNQRSAHIPVFMLTGSENTRDIVLSMELGAEAFFTKPDKYSEMVDLFNGLKSKWTSWIEN